jgi:transposase-like protein
MSEKKRKIFSSQSKAKIALEAIRGAKTVNEIAQEFGVHPTQVGLWKKELQD